MTSTSSPARRSTLARAGYRGRTTLVKLAALGAIEAVIVSAYAGNRALDHYLLHPLIGLAAALSILIALRAAGVRVREEILICYAFASFARVPDFIYAAGPKHAAWMDVFLLHISFDDIIHPAMVFLALQVAVLAFADVRLKAVDE